VAEIIKWDEKYSVGNTLLDSQHKKLIALINELHSAMKDGKGKEALQKVLDELVLYTIEHFSTEEQLMLKASYPHYSEHKRQHEDLTRRAVSLQNSYRAGETPLTLDVLKFLRDWLIVHIEGSDKKYKDMLF
jgi:hemerythrin